MSAAGENGSVRQRRQSSSARNPEEPEDPPRFRAVPLRVFGLWREVQSKTRDGRIYYYNRVTEQSTWPKPPEWVTFDEEQTRWEAERRARISLSAEQQARALLSEPEEARPVAAS
ncbi:unnamed protein product [Caenorhabditis sp. 36 PRJEB53466]|nr:unnamed protein product [Caenorhabditis sp. 36 PRJEB53466]